MLISLYSDTVTILDDLLCKQSETRSWLGRGTSEKDIVFGVTKALTNYFAGGCPTATGGRSSWLQDGSSQSLCSFC